MAKESDLKRVLNLLSVWIVRIRTNNAIFLFDINKIAESFCLKLLNLVYELELTDLNLEKANFPGLDLGDQVNSKIAYQISSRTDTNKVISTLRTVVKKKYHETFTGGIKFLILSDGEKITFPRIDPKTILTTFKPDADILYIDDIVREIKKIFDSDEVRFLKIKNLIDSDISIDEPPKKDESFAELLALINGLNTQIAELQKEHNVDFKLNNRFSFAKDLSLPNIPILSNRAARIKEASAKASEDKPLWISGNVSTGKTQFALLLGRQFAGSSYWFDAGNIKQEQTFVETVVGELMMALNINSGTTLQDAIKEILKLWGQGSLLIINDVPQLTGKEFEKRNFSLLLKEAVDAKVNVIITSNYEPPFSKEDEIFDHIQEFPIPMFSEEEVGEVMKVYGASDDDIKDATQLIEAMTEGHPLIVNAVCKYLQDRSWEIDNDAILAIFKGNFGEKYKAELYSRIIESSNDDNTKNLLYRLKPINGAFTDAEVRAISNIKPEIDRPLETVQRLKGIWLRIVDDGKLELSPLVKQMDSNLSAQLENDVNTALGDLILSKKLISQLEAYTVLNYYQKGNAYPKLSLVLILVLQESLKNKDLFFTWGFDLYWYYTKLPDGISPFFRVLIRFLQINVAIQHEKDIDFLVKDIEEISEKEDVGLLGKVMKNIIFHHVFAKTNPHMALSNFIEAQKGMAALEIDLPDFPVKELVQDDFVWLTFYKLRTKQEFTDWFTTFGDIKDRFTANDIRNSQGYIVAGHALVHLCLTPKENLEQGIELLKFIAESANKVGLQLITVYALRYIIRLFAVHGEDLAKSQQFIDPYKDLLDSEPIYNYLIKEETGRQLYYQGNNGEALNILDKIVATELPGFYVEDFDIYRIFPQLIEKDSQQKAHEFLLRGLKKAVSDPRSLMIDRIKMYGEAGISFWLVGDNKQALHHLEKGYELLLDNFDNSEEHQAAVIRFGSIANYIKCIVIDGTPPTKTADGGNYAIPVRGNFYFTIDKMLEGGYYFDERKFISATVFENAFEFYDDYETSRKWGLRCIEISMDLADPKFTGALLKNIFYLITDRKYQKAVNLYLYIEDSLKKLSNAKEADEDPALRKVLDESKAAERNELYYFQYLVVPPVFTIAEDVVSGKISQSELPSVIDELFSYLSIELKDKETLLFMEQLYRRILVDKISPGEINALLDSYHGGFKSQVYTVGYILGSLNAPVMDAARMHFSLMPSIEQAFNNQFSAFYRFCIVPFFLKFWQKKFDDNSTDFMYADHWLSASVPYFTNTSIGNKLKFLLQCLVHHLNVPLESKLTDWVSVK